MMPDCAASTASRRVRNPSAPPRTRTASWGDAGREETSSWTSRTPTAGQRFIIRDREGKFPEMFRRHPRRRGHRTSCSPASQTPRMKLNHGTVGTDLPT